jgi:hypothetical protein
MRTIQDIRHPTNSQVHVVIKRDTENNEFVCRLYTAAGHYVPADYFTSDKADALATAHSMVQRAG